MMQKKREKKQQRGHKPEKKRFPFLSAALVVFVLCLLFFFSGQDRETSGGLSGKIVQWLCALNCQWSLNAKALEHFVRKAAHFSIYTALGLGLTGLSDYFTQRKAARLGLSVGAGAFFASADELHQRFVPGRCGCVSDVVLDSAGVVFGFIVRRLAQAFFYRMRAKAKKRKENNGQR